MFPDVLIVPRFRTIARMWLVQNSFRLFHLKTVKPFLGLPHNVDLMFVRIEVNFVKCFPHI